MICETDSNRVFKKFHRFLKRFLFFLASQRVIQKRFCLSVYANAVTITSFHNKRMGKSNMDN